MHAALLFACLAHPERGQLQPGAAAGLLRLNIRRYTPSMLVHGGSPGRARVASFASITSTLLVLGAGCGSRTSMLDVDAYSSDGLGGFGNTAGSANAVDPQRSAPACENYCKGFTVKCPAELSGRDCRASCAKEVNGNGKACQSLGIKALECLTPSFSSTSRNATCDDAKNDGATACSRELVEFAQCAKPTNVPMPNPQPDPRPNRLGLVRGCDEALSSTPDTCIRLYSCMDGSYLVECVSQLDGNFSCSCSFPSGMMQGAIYGPVADPCRTAATDCRFY
jgi:hypothetical protein